LEEDMPRFGRSSKPIQINLNSTNKNPIPSSTNGDTTMNE